MLTNIERKLLIKCLERAIEDRSNAGCNDFDLINDGGLTLREATEFNCKVLDDNKDTPGFNSNLVNYDWYVMQYLVERLRIKKGS